MTIVQPLPSYVHINVKEISEVTLQIVSKYLNEPQELTKNIPLLSNIDYKSQRTIKSSVRVYHLKIAEKLDTKQHKIMAAYTYQPK